MTMPRLDPVLGTLGVLTPIAVLVEDGEAVPMSAAPAPTAAPAVSTPKRTPRSKILKPTYSG